MSFGSRADGSNANLLLDGVVIVVLLYRIFCFTIAHRYAAHGGMQAVQGLNFGVAGFQLSVSSFVFRV